MDLNVLKDFPYRPRYYITHPWKWFKECWINLKNAWYRISRGYAYIDLWNMDDWMLTVLPNMLRELAKRHQAYPGWPPFDTPEAWENWLRKMADDLEYLREDNDERNEYASTFFGMMEERRRLDGITTTYTLNDDELDELKDKYFARNKEIAKEKEAKAMEVGQELFKYIHHLWD